MCSHIPVTLRSFTDAFPYLRSLATSVTALIKKMAKLKNTSLPTLCWISLRGTLACLSVAHINLLLMIPTSKVSESVCKYYKTFFNLTLGTLHFSFTIWKNLQSYSSCENSLLPISRDTLFTRDSVIALLLLTDIKTKGKRLKSDNHVLLSNYVMQHIYKSKCVVLM